MCMLDSKRVLALHPAILFTACYTSAISVAAACSVAAPFWFWLAAALRPASYIRLATALVSVSYCLAFVALHVTQLLSIAVGLPALTNMVACPLLSLGMFGEEDVDVFKVRLRQPIIIERRTK